MAASDDNRAQSTRSAPGADSRAPGTAFASDVRRPTSDAIAIAGAGLAGRLLAWQLLRRGHRVSLFDHDDGDGQGAAGLIAAAMLAPCSEAITAGPTVFDPGLRALDAWADWLAQLEADSGMAVDYRQRGSLAVAHAADSAELDWFQQRLHGVAGVQPRHWRWLDAQALAAMEPELGFNRALHLPAEGCVDNRALFRALGIAIERLGGQCHWRHEVTVVTPGLITTNHGEFPCDLAVDCRGFGARVQLAGFRGVRGELLWVRAPEVNLGRPVRLMHPRYHLYITPKPDHVYVAGATEIESESMAPVTVRSALELLSALYSVHAGFAEAQILEMRSHCRPAFADNLPKIIHAPGLMRLNGLYRHGYLLGPALIDSALALLDNQPVLPPVTVETEDPRHD